MTPTVTTVIPTFRRPALLRRAIRSALAQTYPHVRVRVFDNASGDETQRVVEELAAADPRVEYHRHPTNIGVFENFLFGMRAVDTPLFSFLSDDDVIFPNFYELAVAAIEAHPNAMLFAGSTLEFGERGGLLYAPLAYWPREGVFEPPEGALRMLDNHHPTWTGIVFRREVTDRVGLLDRDVGLPSDLDYALRAAARFPMLVSFAPCAAYITHAGSNSMSETVAVVPGYEKMIQTLGDDERIDAATRSELRRRLLAQVRGKLLEISVKSLVRGDAEGSRAAALMLRDRYHARASGSALLALRAACVAVPPLHRALAWAEGVRLRARARASRERLRAQQRDDAANLEAYSRYLETPAN